MFIDLYLGPPGCSLHAGQGYSLSIGSATQQSSAIPGQRTHSLPVQFLMKAVPPVWVHASCMGACQLVCSFARHCTGLPDSPHMLRGENNGMHDALMRSENSRRAAQCDGWVMTPGIITGTRHNMAMRYSKQLLHLIISSWVCIDNQERIR